jgi:hypothetical protein
MKEHAYPEEHIQLANKVANFYKLMSSDDGVGTIEMIELTDFLMDGCVITFWKLICI